MFVHKVLYIMRVIRPEFFCTLLFSLLLCVFPVFAETNQAINIEQLKSDYYFVSSLFPREEGSENEKKNRFLYKKPPNEYECSIRGT